MAADGLSFEVEWPRVAPRLHRTLRARRVPDGVTEDLVQETGARLFEIWERVDPERDVWPLALTIALNILRDQIRAEARRQEVEVPGGVAGDDTETVALARVELGRVRAALGQLTAGQRAALLAEIGVATEPAESASAIKMLRMRGRKRLRTIIDGVSGVAGSLQVGLQRILRSGSTLGLGEQLAPCASVAAGVFCVAGLGSLAVVTGPGTAVAASPVTAPVASSGGAVSGLGLSAHRGHRWVTAARPGRERAPAILSPARGDEEARKLAFSTSPRRPADEAAPTSPRVETGPGPGRPTSRPDEGVRVEESRVSVGPDGYHVSATIRASAAGHEARGRFTTSSGSGGDAGGRPPGLRTPLPGPFSVPSVGAKAELDGQPAVELGSEREPSSS